MFATIITWNSSPANAISNDLPLRPGFSWAAAMFSDSSSPVNWVGKSPGGAIHVS
ncbi:hypothetical protein ACFPRL_09995 [Pseudoclavibacter helvolus]